MRFICRLHHPSHSCKDNHNYENPLSLLSLPVIMKKNTSCQFASPLDCDIHSQPEVSGFPFSFRENSSAPI